MSWQLEGTDTDLIVLPALTEVADRRLHILPVGGAPLVYVAVPGSGASPGQGRLRPAVGCSGCCSSWSRPARVVAFGAE